MRIKGHNLSYHSMLLPGIILLIIFSVVPMIGIYMAFLRYSPFAPWWGLGSTFVGWDNFEFIFTKHPAAVQVMINTVIIAVMKIIAMLVVPVTFAVLLNECLSVKFKRSVQTIVYLPHFLSWVIAGAMFTQILAPTGMINTFLMNIGIVNEPIGFLTSDSWFRSIVVTTDIWKSFGFSAVIYIAAITSIDPTLFEAAEIDGANRWQKIKHITIPCILPTIILMSTLALGGILNAGFDQIYNLYNPMVYSTGDIIDTFVFRVGIEQAQYHVATAVGLVKSFVSMILIILSWWLASKFAGYRIF